MGNGAFKSLETRSDTLLRANMSVNEVDLTVGVALLWERHRLPENALESLDGFGEKRPALFSKQEHVGELTEMRGASRPKGVGMLQSFAKGGRRTRKRCREGGTDGNGRTALGHWRRFCAETDLPSILRLDTSIPWELALGETIMEAFGNYLARVVSPNGKRGPGLGTARVIHAYMNAVPRAHFEEVRRNLDALYGVTARFKEGREQELIDVAGVHEPEKKAGFTNDMVRDWDTIGWRFPRSARPERKTIVIKAAIRLGGGCLNRGASIAKTSRAFNENRHLVRAGAQWFDLEHTRVEPTQANLLALLSSGGYCTIRRLPAKNDKTGQKFAHLPPVFRLGEGGLQFAEAFLQLEMDDPCVDPVMRARTPFLVDPDTGSWLVRDTLVALMRTQTQRAFRELHAREVAMSDIIRTWSGKSFRIGGVVAYETMGATDPEIAQAGAWSEKGKGHRPYSRIELQKAAARTGAAGRVQTQILHNGPIGCYPSRRPVVAEAPGKGVETWESKLVGETVWKERGTGPCRGRIGSVRMAGGEVLWCIEYVDGDEEDWDRAMLARYASYLLPYEGEEGLNGEEWKTGGQGAQARKRWCR